ncbi:MAG: sugar kinase [Planctomycetes bacterium]|nr:sugar kinase [Planctomycetota bacterium]
MSLLVVGSIAFDTIETAHRRVDNVLGGSASYFSTCASFFTKPRLVGVVGSDFSHEHIEFYRARGIDTSGLEIAEGRTFRWHGRYQGDLSSALTVSVELNVFADFRPKIPAAFRDSRFVFLANGSPKTQLAVLEQVAHPDFVLADSMNLWIETERAPLLDLMQRVDGLILNNHEAVQLSGRSNLIAAARKILEMGPRVLIIKKAEHGAFLMTRDEFFAIPAFPLGDVNDPTGAGDSFAGGMMGYLANTRAHSFAHLKRGLLYGTVTASYAIEDFSLERLKRLHRTEIEHRYQDFLRLITP